MNTKILESLSACAFRASKDYNGSIKWAEINTSSGKYDEAMDNINDAVICVREIIRNAETIEKLLNAEENMRV